VGAVASIFTGPWLAVILAVGVAVFFVALRRWTVAVGCLVAADLPTWSWESWLKTAANIVYWGAVAGIAAAFLLLAYRVRVARLWLIAAGAATVLLAVTSAWSLAPRTTLKETVSFAAVLMTVGFVASRLQHDPHEADGVVRALAPIVPAAFLLSLFLILAEHSQAVAQGGGSSGFMNGANALGILTAPALPFLLAQPAIASRMLPLAVTIAVVTFVVTLSAARTGIAGVALGLVVFELGRRRWLRLGLGLAVWLAAAALAVEWAPAVPTLGAPLPALVVPAPTSNPASTPSPAAPSGPAPPVQATRLFGQARSPDESLLSALVGARDEAWKEAVRLVPKRPAFGNGFGTGSLLFDHYGSRRHFHYFVGAYFSGVNVHDAYLQEILELGVVGGPLFLAPAVLALLLVLAGLRRGWASTAEAALAASLAAVLFCAIFESTLAEFGPMTMLAWLSTVGVVVTAVMRRRSAAERTPEL
jgi:O-Antigen ligase